MKKIISALSLSVMTFLVIPMTALAQVQLNDPVTGKTGGDVGSIDVAVTMILKYVLGVIGVVALIAFVYGGIMWLTSMGDANKIAKGKTIMVWAIMGLIVIFASYAIVNLLFGALGVAGGATAK